jgi:hypothetical protein
VLVAIAAGNDGLGGLSQECVSETRHPLVLLATLAWAGCRTLKGVRRSVVATVGCEAVVLRRPAARQEWLVCEVAHAFCVASTHPCANPRWARAQGSSCCCGPSGLSRRTRPR